MTHSCLLEARNRSSMHLRLTVHEEGRVNSCICIASVSGAAGTTGCNDLTAGAHDGKNFPLFGSPGHISQHSFVLDVHTHVCEAQSWAVFAVTHDCGLYTPASTVFLATLCLGGGLWSVDDSVVLEGDDRVFFLSPPLSLISSYFVMEWDTGEGVSSLIYPAAMYTRLHHHRMSCDNSANAPMGEVRGGHNFSTKGFPSVQFKMAADKRRYRSKTRPSLEYTVESFCFGYKKAAQNQAKKGRPLVCYGVNFVKVTINKGEVSMGQDCGYMARWMPIEHRREHV